MNHNHYEAIQCVQKLAYILTKEDYAEVDVTIHPPFTDLRSVQTMIDADELKFILGAQHCHEADSGAFTGEVSAAFLAKLNVSYVIVGHSERREIFGETNEAVNAKIVAIQKHKMTPIVCVGETLAEREAGKTHEKVLGQVRSALEKRSVEQIKSLVVAYEPIWAIGTGKTATLSGSPSATLVVDRRTLLALLSTLVPVLERVRVAEVMTECRCCCERRDARRRRQVCVLRASSFTCFANFASFIFLDAPAT